jgi:hypothetical protein
VKGFTESGFKTQVQPLSHFQEDYGLAAGSDDEEDEDDEDEEMYDSETGSDASTDDDE